MSIESVMLSNHLTLCHLLLFLPSIFASIRVFSSELALHIKWPKYGKFSISITLSNEYSGVNFLQDWLIWSPCSPRDSPESFPTPQFRSIDSSVLRLLYGWKYIIWSLTLSESLFSLICVGICLPKRAKIRTGRSNLFKVHAYFHRSYSVREL